MKNITKDNEIVGNAILVTPDRFDELKEKYDIYPEVSAKALELSEEPIYYLSMPSMEHIQFIIESALDTHFLFDEKNDTEFAITPRDIEEYRKIFLED